MSYSSFAHFYDIFTRDVDYSARADLLLNLFKKHGKPPSLLLDAACGTGSFTVEFLSRGIDVIGVDISPEMLSCARIKAVNAGFNPLLLCQSLTELDLFGTIDGAVCTLDAVNHIPPDEVLSAIQKISLFSEPGSLFIFDVNTQFKHENILADNAFVFEEEDVFAVWKNELDPETLQVDIFLDFFLEEPDGRYTRTSEDFTEYYYDDDYLLEVLTSAGYTLLETLDEWGGQLNPASQRKLFVAQKN